MGIFAQIKQTLDEAAARRAAEERALYESMKPYHRGYDVYPDEVCDHFVGMLRKSIVTHFLIKLFLLALAAGGIAAGFLTKTVQLIVILPLPALILLLLIIRDISRLNRISAKKYDAFGAMVTNSRVDSHSSTDSDGNTTTTYEYYIWLNGIKCEVPKKEFDKTGIGTYTYFVRLKAKYIKNDLFFLYPTDPSEAEHRIGQHYPKDELRLYNAPSPNGLTTLLCVLGVIAAIGGAIAYAAGRSSDTLWLMTAIGGGAVTLVGLIARGISINMRAQEKIVQKIKHQSRD